jgi:ketosteroid isomerase-like protein
VEPAREQRIREAYAAFAAGDIDAVLAGFAPDIVLENPDYAMESGTRMGLDGARKGLQALHDQFAEMDLELREIEEGPDGVLVVVRVKATGRVSGAPIDATLAHVYGFRDGLVVRYRWFATAAEGRAAAGVG